MTQYARPDSDVSDGSWINSAGDNVDLYSCINEASTPDGAYVEVADDMFGTPESVTVGLGGVTDPESDAGHNVVVRAKEGGGMGMVTLDVTLKDTSITPPGTIKTQAFTPGGSFGDHTMSLSTDQAGDIGDYSALQLIITATDNMAGMTTTTVSQAYFECPDAPAPAPTVVAKNEPEAFAMFID